MADLFFDDIPNLFSKFVWIKSAAVGAHHRDLSRYNRDFRLKSLILASRMRCQHTPIPITSGFVAKLQNLRELRVPAVPASLVPRSPFGLTRETKFRI